MENIGFTLSLKRNAAAMLLLALIAAPGYTLPRAENIASPDYAITRAENIASPDYALTRAENVASPDYAITRTENIASPDYALPRAENVAAPGYTLPRTENIASPDYAITRAENATADSLFMEATSLFIIEKPAEALDVYLQLLEKDPDNATAAYQVAQLLTENKQFSQALIYAEKACMLMPENPWFHLLWAQICKTVRQFDKAAEIYRHLQTLQPENLDFAYEEANMYVLGGNLKNSIAVYNRLEDRFGISDEWSMQKYKIYLSVDEDKAARAEIEKISAARPTQIKYLQMLAQMCMQEKAYKQAYAYLKKVLALNPDEPYIHISLADYYRNVGDFKQAFLSLEKAVNNPNLDFQTKINVLQAYYAGKDELKPTGDLYNQAIKLFTALNKVHPDEPQGFFSYGKFLLMTDNVAEAVPLLEHALELDSGVFAVWNLLIHACHLSGDTARLQQYADGAIERFPEQPAPYMYLALTRSLNKDFGQAIEYARQSNKRNIGRDPFIQKVNLQVLGDAYFETGEMQPCLDAYKQLFELEPKDPYIRNNYAYYLALSGRELAKAEVIASQLCKEIPGNPTFLDTYGWVLYRLGKYEKALSYIKAALDKGGKEDVTVWEHYGDIFYKLGDVEKAREQWKKALRYANPKESDAIKNKIENPGKWIE